MRHLFRLFLALQVAALGAATSALADEKPLPVLPVPASGAVETPSTPAPEGSATEVRLLDPNDPESYPVISNDRGAPEPLPDAYLVQNDQTLTVSAAEGLLKNDVDADGDALYVTAIQSPQHGTITLSADGRFTYIPDSNFEGNESLTYYMSDGSATGTSILTLHVLPRANRAPIPMADAYAVEAGGTLSVDEAGGLLPNDIDLDGDSIHVTAVQAPGNGSITMNADGSFTYTPDPGFSGLEALDYYISDGALGGASPGQLSIQVLPAANRVPLGGTDYWYTSADTPLQVNGDVKLVHNDLDPDGDSIHLVSFYPPSHGTASVFADGSFTYFPDPGFEGEDSFRYLLADANGASSFTFTNVALAVGIYGFIPSGVLTPPEMMGFRLQSAVPNPFNPTTELAFNIDAEGPAALRVYSLKGEVVATLVDEILPAGAHTTVWDGRDAAGRQLASGTYFAELRHGGQRAVQKLTLVK